MALTPKHRKAISEALRGKVTRSADTRAKIAASWTPERRAAHSARMRNLWRKIRQARTKSSAKSSETTT